MAKREFEVSKIATAIGNFQGRKNTS